jgi:hypothetical protein
VEHVVWVGEMRNAYKSLENLKGRDNSEGPNIDRRIILKWILVK